MENILRVILSAPAATWLTGISASSAVIAVYSANQQRRIERNRQAKLDAESKARSEWVTKTLDWMVAFQKNEMEIPEQEIHFAAWAIGQHYPIRVFRETNRWVLLRSRRSE